ncbi:MULTISPECIES: recombinase family protein [unclassified Tenacibaculum]|uniref:recombinase family protein n=1 Tax=unclassified Tenacibaculum TaxID=2635139 RepID=UPI001F318CA5|nr:MULTISPECIES: recombinase family protein [unclassified Tenacibaculum]MCF2875412.1 recombinase family protein [Tenacibaculum sp. Cn5-1]MCF2935488.1 recombinase family protein [Tenacibaculum sp. Cn5-34]MCG7512048.1 recombinase family protein [Tenacibaculum sp. Cn5-46]
MKFGYARVSTPSQNLEMQIDALELFGVDLKNIHTDIASGAKEDRKGLEEMLMKLREGDSVIVWKSCRLARNVKHMLSMMELFESNNIEFKSIQEPFLDTSSPHGKFIFNVFTSLNQMDREINRERVMSGLASARKRGIKGGRPKGISQKLKDVAPGVVSMWKDDTKSIKAIQKMFGISQGSVYKCLEFEGIDVKRSEHKNKGNQNAKRKRKIKITRKN